MDLLLMVMLAIIGIVGLVKRRIKVSKKKELSGTPVVILSVFYLIAAAYLLFVRRVDLLTVVVVGVVTLAAVLFVKGKQPVTQ